MEISQPFLCRLLRDKEKITKSETKSIQENDLRNFFTWWLYSNNAKNFDMQYMYEKFVNEVISQNRWQTKFTPFFNWYEKKLKIMIPLYVNNLFQNAYQ